MVENRSYKQKLNILLDIYKKNKNDIKTIKEISFIYKILNDNLNYINFLKKEYNLDKKNYKILNNLGIAYKNLKDYASAKNYFFKSITLNKNYLIGNFNYALLLEEIGELKDASKYYLRTISIDKYYLPAYYNLYRIDKNYFKNDFFLNIIDFINKNKSPLKKDLSYAYFLLARKEEELKNYEKEVEYLEKGHNLYFNSNHNNKNLCDFWINKLPNRVKKFKFDKLFNNSNFQFEPIFIFGLPRSGTTLVETLMTSSEEKIDNFGENSIIYKSLINLEKKENINLLDNFNHINLKSISDIIYKNYKIQNLSKKKNYKLIDRSMENFLFYKIILNVFPNAKIIHCHRDYAHNFVAIFKQCLENLIWTHDKDYTLKYMKLFEMTIKEIKKNYPKNILTINLKDLTNEPKIISKKLMKFCNIKWSYEILNFYNRKNMIVTTASNIQIRKKIYNYDEKIYGRYKKNLLDYFSKNYK